MPAFWKPSTEQGIERMLHGHPGEQRHAEQQLQRDGGAEHFGSKARSRGDDGDFAGGTRAERFTCARDRFPAAGLREIAARRDAQARAQRLQRDRHEVRHDENPQQSQ